jgi:demethylmenaquinone methyltransferase/2-methoxy-6-polyprenyl-1,4-benzoquinol methylase
MARWYDRFMNWRDVSPIRIKLNNARIIIDVGGGTGVISQKISKDVIIVDPSQGMLREAKKKGMSNLVRGVAEYLPFRNDIVDAVICTDALHHTQDPEKSISEMIRVTRPGGQIIIEEFDIGRWWVRLFVGVIEKLAVMKPQFISAEKLTEIFQREGYRVEIEPYTKISYLAHIVL